MKRDRALTKATNTQIVNLVAKQKLVIEHQNLSNVLNIIGSDGMVSLSIHITKEGSVLRIGGGELTIQAEGNLAIDAESVAIHSRKGMALTTGENLHIEAAGDLHSKARVQTITADLGNVDIKANDDVTLDGERVRMNC